MTTPKEAVEIEDFGGDEGELVGSVEGVGLRIGEVVNSVEAEEDVA